MARCSYSNAKLVSTLVVDNLSLALSRRSYAQGMVMSNSSNVMRRAGGSNNATSTTPNDENSWVPDPVTGYYRPANHADDVDVAELREMLLTTSNANKFNRSSH
uniref:Late embryogenesis abundant protein n=1 Tax=Tamarix androssowii TaxID=189785 RepID=Q0Z8J9_9CARY|nr:late embryogenesis abundant protein [Tamarix androssowii]